MVASSRVSELAKAFNDPESEVESLVHASHYVLGDVARSGLLTFEGAVRFANMASYDMVSNLVMYGPVDVRVAQLVRDRWREEQIVARIAERTDIPGEVLSYLADECWEDEIIDNLLINPSLPGAAWLKLIHHVYTEGWILSDEPLQNTRNVSDEDFIKFAEWCIASEGRDVSHENYWDSWDEDKERNSTNFGSVSHVLSSSDYVQSDTVGVLLAMPLQGFSFKLFRNIYSDEIARVRRTVDSLKPELDIYASFGLKNILENPSTTVEGFLSLVDLGFRSYGQICRLIENGDTDRLLSDLMFVLLDEESSKSFPLEWQRRMVSGAVANLCKVRIEKEQHVK